MALNNPLPQVVAPAALSQNQLEEITKKDSALMQRAATKGKQYANKRGLLNSSLAAGASQAAMLEAATPIAQQDAQTSFQSIEAGKDRDLNVSENQKDRTWKTGEMSKDRGLEEDKMARETATELFRQVSGMNASLTDAIAEIQSSDMKPDQKQSAVDKLFSMHKTSLNTSSMLADFDIVNGKVVYNDNKSASETVTQSQKSPTSSAYPYYNYGNWGF